MGRYLWSQKLTGFHAAHSATTLLSGMPGMSIQKVCGVELRAFLRRVVSYDMTTGVRPGPAPGQAGEDRLRCDHVRSAVWWAPRA